MMAYIDAEKLKLSLLTLQNTLKACDFINGVSWVQALIDAVDLTQTADVAEVKHGEWLCINGTIFCSECQEKALYKYNENDNDDFPFLLPMKSKRCPNCGAKMDEKEVM